AAGDADDAARRRARLDLRRGASRAGGDPAHRRVGRPAGVGRFAPGDVGEPVREAGTAGRARGGAMTPSAISRVLDLYALVIGACLGSFLNVDRKSTRLNSSHLVI